MLQYVYTRMWILHATINADKLDEKLSVDRFISLADLSNNVLSGNLKITRRISKESEANGHDYHPAIDMVFDDEAVNLMSQYSDNGEDSLVARQVLLRITDFGYLQIFISYDVPLDYDITKLEGKAVVATRAINNIFNAIKDKLFTFLEKTTSLVNIARDMHLGVPDIDCLKNLYSHDDTYLYSDHILIIVERHEARDKYVLQLTEDQNPICFSSGVKVYTPWAQAIWVSENKLTIEEWLYYLSSENLLLAENALYMAASDCYGALLEQQLLSGGERNYVRRFFGLSTGSKSACKNVTSKRLLQIMIRNNLALQKVIGRRTSLDNEQQNYLYINQEKLKMDKNRLMFRDSEKILRIAVQELETEEKEANNKYVEGILLLFTSLTVYSVAVDVINFLEKERVDVKLWGSFSSITLSIITVVLVIFVFFKKLVK